MQLIMDKQIGKSLKFIGIISARLGSKRLPNKAMREVNGIPLIGYVIFRAKRIKGLDNIVLATTHRYSDKPLVKYALTQNISIYQGEVNDVASRFLNCAKMFASDYMVRMNVDSPFLDPTLITRGIRNCNNNKVEVITNLIGHTFPYGVSVEIFSINTLKKNYPYMGKSDREHVTSYIYEHLEEFNIQTMTSKYPKFSKAHMVVDTESDFRLFKRVVERLGDKVFDAPYWQIAKIYLQEMNL
jgi:spore coat polysaccharide biosynthesis protein SpsF